VRATDIKIDASFAKGDTKNVIAADATSPSFAMFVAPAALALIKASHRVHSDGVYVPADD